MPKNHLKVGQPAPDLTGLNVDDELVQAEDRWADGPTLLTFLRHFG